MTLASEDTMGPLKPYCLEDVVEWLCSREQLWESEAWGMADEIVDRAWREAGLQYGENWDWVLLYTEDEWHEMRERNAPAWR